MFWNIAVKTALAVLLLVVTSNAVAAKGKLGFGIKATSSGFISPVLERLKVATVTPGSPAAAAGLKLGDFITEINGRPVAGAPAREMIGTFRDIQVGQKLRLKIKRDNEFVSIEIVAGP